MSVKQLEGPGAGQAPAAGGRMAAEDRRRQIVDVAMRLFSERGFRGTTTKEIAHAAGVSEAIIFRHFATKEELYTAIIDHKACSGGMGDLECPVAEMIRTDVAGLMEQRNDRAVFEHIALAMMRHHEQDTEFLRLLFYSALENHQLSQLFWDRNVRTMYEFLGSYIRERQRAGALRQLDPLVAVRAFTGMIIHHSVTNTLWDKQRTLLNISNEEAARVFTDILLRGIGASVVASRGGGGAKRARGADRNGVRRKGEAKKGKAPSRPRGEKVTAGV
ncbi:MAG TPA: helix-turn-helix domain-containing protein [Pyrinomonadaceae bacterium]|nr:helix-turn-helix domain-containing protein [Pyrinomonadaceae bacterium]